MNAVKPCGCEDKKVFDCGRSDTEHELDEVRGNLEFIQGKAQKLFRLLDRNTEPGPPVNPDDGECYYCEYGIHDCEYQGDDDWLALPAGHKPDCAWRQAREFIENEKDARNP